MMLHYETLSNVISEELQISLSNLSRSHQEHISQSLQGHKKKTAITTTTQTMAKCGHFPQFLLTL